MRTALKLVLRRIRRLRLPHKLLIGALSLMLISCGYSPKPRGGIENYPGWPMASQAQGSAGLDGFRPVRKIVRPERNRPIRQVTRQPFKDPYPPLKVELPEIPDAEYIREDDLCMTCHETHVTLFKEKNVHRQFSCEECHGPGSEHILSRGQEEGKILNVRRLTPPQRSEICLRCHEKEVVPPHVAQWRTSTHAHEGVSCSDCHRAHHDIPEGTPAVTPPVEGANRPPADALAKAPAPERRDTNVQQTSATTRSSARASLARTQADATGDKLPSLRGTSQNLGAERIDVCTRCHEGSFRTLELLGPHKIGPNTQFKCTSCHDSQGNISLETGEQACLNCHNQTLSPKWHSATHKEAGMICTDCHRPHPPVTPQLLSQFKQGNTAGIPLPMEVRQAELCVRCHEQTQLNLQSIDPHQVGGSHGFQCTTCHDQHGKLLDTTRKDLCLTCHTGPLSSNWHSSTHNSAGMFCTDCHNPHPTLKPGSGPNPTLGSASSLRPMAVIQVDVCVKCHEQTKQLVEIADPHQVGGKNGFMCTTCHNPHGKLNESARQDLCLTCHNGTPTAAWHSSVHNLQGIKCTDCHDPHPDSRVQEHLDIRHTNIRRPNRLPMSVNDPDTCYKCHPQIVGLTQMPSHHPIFEGKMNCSSCHNSHGEALGLLNEPTINLVCYKCHSEVQGPFVYEHPPATQDCTICHNPHGAVANDLLHQPPTFLCLRCHSGHRTGPPFHDSALLPDIGKSGRLQKAFYSDCTQCHSQVHGSDVPTANNSQALGR